MNVVERRVGLWGRRGLIAAGQVKREIESGIQSEAIDRNIAGQRGALRRADQSQVGVGYGTHTLRIAKPDVVARRVQRKIELPVQGYKSTESEIASTGARDQVLHLQTVLIEDKRPVDVAQPIRQIDQ